MGHGHRWLVCKTHATLTERYLCQRHYAERITGVRVRCCPGLAPGPGDNGRVIDPILQQAPVASPESNALGESEVDRFDRAFDRAAGAPLTKNNAVRLLLDARENFPAWLAAIAAARHYVLFESYIIADDGVGHEFIEALAAKAREGVRVCVVYDWLGSTSSARRGSRCARRAPTSAASILRAWRARSHGSRATTANRSVSGDN